MRIPEYSTLFLKNCGNEEMMKLMKLLMLCVPTPYPAQGLLMVQGPPPPEGARTPLGSWGFVLMPMIPMMNGDRSRIF